MIDTRASMVMLEREWSVAAKSHNRCVTDRAESADADIEMTRRKAFPAIHYGTVAIEN
jgi:hypothetical protein